MTLQTGYGKLNGQGVVNLTLNVKTVMRMLGKQIHMENEKTGKLENVSHKV